jgi:(1->4)-alpha-D-glucan 1-alpha-D-glucosylmutase
VTPRRRATYRVQLTADFGFDQAAQTADYLSDLGISHLYTSPYLQAAPGSTHGYDVVDHNSVSSELGGPDAHARMLAALRRTSLGHVIDIVPNHMSIASRANRWWWDVLEKGVASPYAKYFDVDWDPPEARLHNIVLLPVLADQYGRALERGELQLARVGDTLIVRYKDHEFPVAPETVPQAPLDEVVADHNRDPDLLHELLDRQHYRLAWWQASERDLGYRRFFDVNTLIGLAVENPAVFRDTHRLILDLVQAGHVDTLRVDHPDGLQDPEGYLRRLREAAPKCALLVEKILAPDECLPASWPVAGSTGYDFLNLVGGLFIDPDGEEALTEFYEEFVTPEGATAFPAVAREKKLLVLREGLGSDVNRLSALLLRICEGHRRHRDYTRHLLTDALRELVAALPVYRTYVRPAAAQVTDTDRRRIAQAITRAAEKRPDIDAELFDFLRGILTLEVRGELESAFVTRFQQLSAAAMAKGVEDTAFYWYNRFVALNEVGSDPARFGVTVEEFHERMLSAHARHPDSMLATSTHDTKRGEDVRARLAILTECPAQWAAAVREWSARNARHHSNEWPDRNMEYLYYQTLAGAWPLDPARAAQFMEKAAREAKTHTSWTSPQSDYEAAVKRFVEQSLADDDFTGDVERFVAAILAAGRVVSLAQTLVKLTAPGIPDIYQGTELWSLSLVDPDNRRPVDFAVRARLLQDALAASAEHVLARSDEGLPKLWLITRALSLRAARPQAFAPGPAGAYEPIAASGAEAHRIVAFARGGQVVTIVPRLWHSLSRGWLDTAVALPAGRWHNVLTDESYASAASAAALFARFPVALLERTA